MDRIKFKAELLLLLALVWQVCGRCDISKLELDSTASVITKYSNIHGFPTYELLHRPYVEDNGILHIYVENYKYIETQCKNNKFTIPLPNFVKPEFWEETQPDIRCPKKMYSIGYKLNGNPMVVYRSCYDREHLSALFSVATIYLNLDTCATRPTNCQFLRDTAAMTPLQERAFKREGDLDRGHLAPACDFLTKDQKCATFDYANVVPQHKKINQGVWKQIEGWVRNLDADVIHVETGAVEVIRYLVEEEDEKTRKIIEKLPVPKWMYKLIRDVRDTPKHAIITYNSAHSPIKPARPEFCKFKECERSLDDLLRRSQDSEPNVHTYCCDPAQFNPHKVKNSVGHISVATPSLSSQPISRGQKRPYPF